MKVFWGLIGLLVVATVAIYVVPRREARPVAVVAEPAMPDAARADAADDGLAPVGLETPDTAPMAGVPDPRADAGAPTRFPGDLEEAVTTTDPSDPAEPDTGEARPSVAELAADQPAHADIPEPGDDQGERVGGPPPEPLAAAPADPVPVPDDPVPVPPAPSAEPAPVAVSGEPAPPSSEPPIGDDATPPTGVTRVGPSHPDAPTDVRVSPAQPDPTSPETLVPPPNADVEAILAAVAAAAGAGGGTAANTHLTTGDAAQPSSPAEEAGPAVTVQDDGSLLVDGRFTVTGKGTKEDPYRVSWDYLISASETYKPRLGQKKLPEWLTILNDKHVRLTGYVAFPLMAQEPNELLVMLNQWDGCCIGIPPTPYDAVEVKLEKPAVGSQRFTIHGTLEGKFKVDPYLVKDWLVGLYTMEDAVLKAGN